MAGILKGEIMMTLTALGDPNVYSYHIAVLAKCFTLFEHVLFIYVHVFMFARTFVFCPNTNPRAYSFVPDFDTFGGHALFFCTLEEW